LHIFLFLLLTEQMFLCYNIDADRNNPSTPEVFSREYLIGKEVRQTVPAISMMIMRLMR